MIPLGAHEPFTILRGIGGVCIILLISFLLSNRRKQIDWKTVGIALLLQAVLALLIIYVPFIAVLFEWMGKAFVKLLHFTQEGTSFLLGPYATTSQGFVFLIHSLPAIIFFSALVAVFNYWGLIQRLVKSFAWVLRRFIRNISGAEGVVVSANIFLGMSESPILVKDYIPLMTKSELFLVMVSGMATISGSLLGAYTGMLASGDPVQQVFIAKHLLSACVMAAPGAIVIAKIICPQTEQQSIHSIAVSDVDKPNSFLGALTSGTITGVRIAVNVAAMLLVFIAGIAMLNYLTGDLLGHYTGLNNWIAELTDGKTQSLSLQFILGVLSAPLMWLIGVPWDDAMLVGSIFGQKTVMNEFVAYAQMSTWTQTGMFIYEQSKVMAIYLLCGFANFSSIGMLLGALGTLAPGKRSEIASLGFLSLVGGALVSLLSATIVGMFVG